MSPRRAHRLASAGLLALIAGLVLACQPYLSDGRPEVAYQPVAWQCPTPSPVPTVIVGYEDVPPSEAGPPLPGAPTPTNEQRPLYSTPVPTATPYVRTGSDYYLGQRVKVGPIILSVTGYRSQPGAGAEQAVHLVSVEVENTDPQPVELHLEMSLIRTIRRGDGRAVEGTWYPTSAAATAAGVDKLPPAWQPGRTTATLAILAPAGAAEAWGMPFVRGETRRIGQTGDGYVWVRFRNDPDCAGKPGGPPSDAYNAAAPAGAPVVGRGGWPVPPGTAISRGYGCASFYTGVRGDSCPASAPWWHDGVDFASAPGTPLLAVRDNFQILYAGPDTSTMDCSWIDGSQAPHNGFGLYVKGKDPAGYVYWYGHASGFTASSGQTVADGQQIAKMGSTGCSTGTHLHFRVRIDGLDRNPFDVIQQR